MLSECNCTHATGQKKIALDSEKIKKIVLQPINFRRWKKVVTLGLKEIEVDKNAFFSRSH